VVVRNGYARRHGRPPKTPTDFDGAIVYQLHAAEDWSKLSTKVWASRNAVRAVRAISSHSFWWSHHRVRVVRAGATVTPSSRAGGENGRLMVLHFARGPVRLDW
jgi:hypothetical protein